MTTHILHIATSPMGDRSITRKLSAKTLAALQARHPDHHLVTRDLSTHPLPHLDGTTLAAFFTPAAQRDDFLAKAVLPSDQAIDEVLAADIIVIDAPMWNFGIPSSLKAWIDHITRAGRTFAYTATGAQGLTPPGKKTIIVSSRGGIYTDGPFKPMDHQETYLTAVLGFIGLSDISFVRAEGVARGADQLDRALSTADTHIANLVAA